MSFALAGPSIAMAQVRQDDRTQLVGGPLQETRENAKNASTTTYVSKDDPPFLIVHGDRDPLVPHDRSIRLKLDHNQREMRIVEGAWIRLSCAVVASVLSGSVTYAQPRSLPRDIPAKVGGVAVADILQRLGAKLEQGSTAKEIDDYSNHFDRTDPNRDGKHSREEYVDNGRYMTRQARAGIFRAADGNEDGVVTKAEYVLNRIITDEAKTIVQGMDDDKDGLVERAEFVKHAAKLLSNAELAELVYDVFDANGDSGITIPEYLRVWGRWARLGQKSAEERIRARRAELAESASRPDEQPGDDGFVALFDGQTLAGWHAVPEESALDWSVHDGVIVGRGSADRLCYLVWKDERLTDFELRLRYRLPGKGNTGVEIRSQVDLSGKRPFEGYHADLGHVGIGPHILGAWDVHFAKRKEFPCPRGSRLVIDEAGRPHSERIGDALTAADVRPHQWNDVRIIARGKHFQFFVNDKLASEFTDRSKEGRLDHGAIGLQIHDKDMQVEFADIRLQRLVITRE